MFITGADDIDGVRRHVLSDLNRQFKNKLKEKRILNQIKQCEDRTPKGESIFGATLGCTKKVTVDKDSSIVIPRFLDLVLKYLEDKLMTEFLLRKGGSTGRQRVLRKEIEQTERLNSPNVHDVASLLKQWLRELKEPLIPVYLQDIFVKSNMLLNSGRNLLNACLLLPVDHLQTLRYLLKFLNKVASHADQNKMDASNLCIVMTPNIMPCDEKSDSKCNKDVNQLLKERRAVINALMDQADHIGNVPDIMLEFTSMLKSSEDELEKSDNSIMLSISSKRKKRKSLVSELRKKLVAPVNNNARPKEGNFKIHLTPGPKRKADMNLSTGLPKRKTSQKEWEKSSTPKGIVKTSQYQCFTPANTVAKIQFSDTPVSEMSFSSLSSTTSETSHEATRRRRVSSRSSKSGCFRTPKSRARHRSALRNNDSAVASRLAGEADNFSLCAPDPQEAMHVSNSSTEDDGQPMEEEDAFKDNMESVMEIGPCIRSMPTPSTRSLKHRSSLRTSPIAQSNLQKKGSLMRGRPNTIRTGLPSPYRQSSTPVIQHQVVKIIDESPMAGKIENGDYKRCLNKSGDESLMEVDCVIPEDATQKPFHDQVSFGSAGPESGELIDNLATACTRRLQRKSISVSGIEQLKRASMRKSVSGCVILNRVENKLKPLAKYGSEMSPAQNGCEDVKVAITEPKEVLHTLHHDELPTPVKWTSGEKFLSDKLHIKENESTTKRESVLRIQRDNAGKVRANVNKFNDITSLTNTIPNGEFKTPISLIPRTPRRRSKRGQKTPVRIPSVFVKNPSASDSLRSRYHNQDLSRKASLRGERNIPCATLVKQISLDPTRKMHHSALSPCHISTISKSPLKDSNVINIKISSHQ